MSEQAWYLVYSKPKQEERAQCNLARQGFDVFLPRLRVQVRKGGRFVRRIDPMFPRYLFIRLDARNQDWGPIRSTFGVATLIRFGGRPATIPDDLVDSLLERADATGIVDNLVPPPVEAGTRVRVIDGLLQGYEAIVEARNGQERVRVLLDLVDRHATATLSSHHVTPVSQ